MNIEVASSFHCFTTTLALPWSMAVGRSRARHGSMHLLGVWTLDAFTRGCDASKQSNVAAKGWAVPGPRFGTGTGLPASHALIMIQRLLASPSMPAVAPGPRAAATSRGRTTHGVPWPYAWHGRRTAGLLNADRWCGVYGTEGCRASTGCSWHCTLCSAVQCGVVCC